MKLKLRESVTCKDFISNTTNIVDPLLRMRNKHELLGRVQYWKEYFKERDIKNISLHSYQSLDSTAIILACMENGITMHTGAYSANEIESLSYQVDLTIVGFGKDELKYNDRFLHVRATAALELREYVPDSIDPDSVLIINHSDPNRVFTKDTEHTNNEVLAAAYIASVTYPWISGSIATIQYTGNKETLPLFMIAPLFAGATIYSCSHMIELVSLIRNFSIDSIGITVTHLQALKLIEDSMNNDSPFGTNSFKFDLEGATIFTPRLGPQKSTPSAEICDWLFNRDVIDIVSVYIPDNLVTPQFSSTVEYTDKQYFSNKLGNQLRPWEIVDNMLYVSNHNNQLVNTGDYAICINDQVIFKGNQLVNRQFIADVQQFILGIVRDPAVTTNDFILDYKDSVLNIYSFRQSTFNALKSCAQLSTELFNFAEVEKLNFEYWDRSKDYSV